MISDCNDKSSQLDSGAKNKVLFLYWPLFLILIVTGVVYYDVLDASYIFDDYNLLLSSDCYYGVEKIPAMFTEGKVNQCSYRPMRYVSYAIDYSLFDGATSGYHLTNVLLHLLSVVLVFLISQKLFRKRNPAFWVAAIYALHPVHVDVVAYISGRRDGLAGLFFFLGLWFYLTYLENNKKLLALFAFVALGFGLLSKEMVVTLPAIFIFLEILTLIRQSQEEGRVVEIRGILRELIKRRWWLYGPLLLCAVAFVLYRGVFDSFSNMQGRYWGGSILNNYLTVMAVYFRYFEMIFFPLRLAGDYSLFTVPPVETISDWRWIPGILVTVGLLLAAFRTRFVWPLFSFGILFFFVTLLPVSHIFPHHELMAEHYLYIPLLGLSLAVVDLALKAFYHPIGKRAVFYGASLWLVFCVARVSFRNLDYHDQYTFAASVVRESPDCMRGNLWMGNLSLRSEQREQASEYYLKVLELAEKGPIAAEALWQLATIADYFGNRHKLADYLSRYIRIDQDNTSAKQWLGALWGQLGEFEKSELLLREVVSKEPENRENLLDFSITLMNLGKFSEACEVLEKCRALDSSRVEVVFQLGNCYLAQKDYKNAAEMFGLSIQENPDDVRSLVQMGRVMLDTNRLDEAKRYLLQAQQIAPHDQGVKWLEMRIMTGN